jgi:hypothetical protein
MATPSDVRFALERLARRRRWRPDCLAALVSLETGGTYRLDAGAPTWSPERTGSGLLGWTERGARALGVAPSPHPPSSAAALGATGSWSSWTIASMGLDDQVELIDRTLSRAFEVRGPKRPVDYVLASIGAAPGLTAATTIRPSSARNVLRFPEPVAVRELENLTDRELRKVRVDAGGSALFDVLFTGLCAVLVRRL